MKASERRTSDANAQRPKRSTVTVLRSLIVEPAPVKTHVVVETLRLDIECVVKKRGAGCGECPRAFRVPSQLTKQHREDECARVIIGAIAFGKIGDTEDSVLEHSRRVGHAGEMTQLQLRQFSRL